MLKKINPFVPLVLITAVVFILFACNLSVENPSNIEDKDLDVPEAIPAIVAGVGGDYAYAMTQPGGGGLINAGAMLTDELVHCGTWIGLRGLSDGISRDDWVEAQTRWGAASRARWVAERAIERIKALVSDPDENPDLAYVTLFAGFANRAMGDNFDYCVINGGPLQDHTVYYERAEKFFTDAINIATKAIAAGKTTGEANYGVGDDGKKITANEMLLAAYGGRAHVRLMLAVLKNQPSKLDEAFQDAQKVPTDFVFWEIHSTNSGREENDMHWWTYERNECTVWGTPFATWGYNVDDPNDPTTEGDPRVPFDKSGGQGGDGRRPFWRSHKYPSRASDVPIVKGTEMRLIEAEYYLRKGDIASAISKINEVRNYYNTTNGWNLPLYDASGITTTDSAWTVLMKERGIELWLEGKRLADLRRWKVDPGFVPFKVVREEVAGKPADEDLKNMKNVLDAELYLMVSKEEKDSNPNF